MGGDLVKVFTDGSFKKDTGTGVVLVDFYAAWCPPCRMLSPIIDQIAQQFSGKMAVGKVDIDSEQETASQFSVTSVPTMIIFKNGKEVERFVGLRDFDTIKKAIEKVV